MLVPWIATGLIVCWKLIEVVDDYFSHWRPGRTIARAASISLATAAALSPATFASAAAAYIDERASELSQSLLSSIQDVLEPAPPPTDDSIPATAG